MSALFSIARKLRLWGVMSSLSALLCVGVASAHEVVPTIADLTVADGAVTFEMRVNIEAQLSGINLDEVDENCAELDYITGNGKEMDNEIIMSNNFAFGGINTSLIFKRWA